MNAKNGLGVLGVIGVVIGILVGFSAVTSLAAAGVPPGAAGAGFSYAVDGSNVTVVDHSALPSGCYPGSVCVVNATEKSLVLSWGAANLSATRIVLGGSYSHTYPAAGTYAITDTLVYYDCVRGGAAVGTASGTALVCGTSSSVASTTVTLGGIRNGNSGRIGVFPAFNVALGVNGRVTVNDMTTYSNATIDSISINWGDNSAPSSLTYGGSAVHTYQTSGTYRVSEAVVWTPVTPGGYPQTSTIGQNVTVNVTGPCVSACSGTVSASTTTSHSLFVLDAISVAFIVGFGAIAILGFMGVDWRYVLAIGFILFLVGFGIGDVVNYPIP